MFFGCLGELGAVAGETAANHVFRGIAPTPIEGHHVVEGALVGFQPDLAVRAARVVADNDRQINRGQPSVRAEPGGLGVDRVGEANEAALEFGLGHRLLESGYGGHIDIPDRTVPAIRVPTSPMLPSRAG